MSNRPNVGETKADSVFCQLNGIPATRKRAGHSSSHLVYVLAVCATDSACLHFHTYVPFSVRRILSTCHRGPEPPAPSSDHFRSSARWPISKGHFAATVESPFALHSVTGASPRLPAGETSLRLGVGSFIPLFLRIIAPFSTKLVVVTAQALEIYRQAGRYDVAQGRNVRHPEYSLLVHIGQAEAPRRDGQQFWGLDWVPDVIQQSDAEASLSSAVPRDGVGFTSQEVLRFLEDKPMTNAQVRALVPGARTRWQYSKRRGGHGGLGPEEIEVPLIVVSRQAAQATVEGQRSLGGVQVRVRKGRAAPSCRRCNAPHELLKRYPNSVAARPVS